MDIIQYLEYGVYVFYLRYILINCIFGEQFIILKNPLSKVNECSVMIAHYSVVIY